MCALLICVFICMCIYIYDLGIDISICAYFFTNAYVYIVFLKLFSEKLPSMKSHVMFENAKHKDTNSKPCCIWCHLNRYDLTNMLTRRDTFWTGRFSKNYFERKKSIFIKLHFYWTQISQILSNEIYSSVFHLQYVHYNHTTLRFS